MVAFKFRVMRKRFYIGLVVAAVAAGAWFSRMAWRAHKDLVSLHVRNMPLAQVIKRVERQTWETIIADSRLDTLVTLSVDNMPLLEVLDRLAEQAAGLVTTVHAVYKSSPAIEKLCTALRNPASGKEEGWTNLAPQLLPFMGGPGRTMEGGGPKRRFVGSPPDVLATRNLGAERPARGGGMIRVRAGADGGPPQEEIITPERLVMEAKLATGLKTDDPLQPNRADALSVARQVEGKYSVIYALRKSAVGGMMRGPMRRFREGPPESEREDVTENSADTGSEKQRGGPPAPFLNAERDAQRANLSRFMNLTPEQRAQRGRERGNVQMFEDVQEGQISARP
jgi:hypothetical protein